MRDIKCYKLRLFLIRFVIMGMLSYIVEVFFTATINLIESIHNWITIKDYVFNIATATQGHVGIFAFFVYCWAAIPFTFLTNPLQRLIKNDLIFPKFGVLLRGLIFGLIFMGIEFIIGFSALKLFHLRPWDYSNLPLNIDGIITFTLLPLWTLAGIAGEAIHERLLQIDDILLNPKGYTDSHISVGFNRYIIFIEQKSTRKQNRKKAKKNPASNPPHLPKIEKAMLKKNFTHSPTEGGKRNSFNLP